MAEVILRDAAGRFQAGSGYIHGMCDTPEYRAWDNMLGRCYRPSHRYFYDYGGRGITVCDSWKGSFTEFFIAIGRRPSSGHSLDRIDPNGNYEPGNVRWATASVQSYNQRTKRINKTGQTGVCWDTRARKYRAFINCDRKHHELGMFGELSDAIKVRKDAEERFYGSH